jgi:hypothetical protein
MGELSRALPRAFEYYGGSVPMQVGRSRLFRASRSYTDRRYDAVRCPVHPLNPSTRGAPDGLRSEGSRHETLAIVQNWRVSRFRQNRYIDRCRLGFKQYSLHRARLALTGIAPLRLGRIRPYSKHAIVPVRFRISGLLSPRLAWWAEVSSTYLIITDTPFSATTAHCLCSRTCSRRARRCFVW